MRVCIEVTTCVLILCCLLPTDIEALLRQKKDVHSGVKGEGPDHIPTTDHIDIQALFKRGKPDGQGTDNLPEGEVPDHIPLHNLTDIGSLFRQRRQTYDFPQNWGCDLDVLAKSHYMGRVREGCASFDDECENVGPVPEELRLETNMVPPIADFYTKYTHAYNIPVIGSDKVTDEGLRRACYVLKVMLSPRYDIRNGYFKFFGRVAIIGDDEEQCSLWEYRTWDHDYWNARVRGVGPIETIPITSVGDDNLRCKPYDRYAEQDIFLHELTHAIHHMGALYSIQGFGTRLHEAFIESVLIDRKWAGEYAAENAAEYLAVGVQFLFNAFNGDDYLKFGVYDRDSMAAYDPRLMEILVEVFPCISSVDNFIQRCEWKRCNTTSFTKVFDWSYRIFSGCKLIEWTKYADTMDECAQFVAYYEGNVAHHKGSYCEALLCPGTSFGNLSLSQGIEGYSIYTINTPVSMTLELEMAQDIEEMCTTGPDPYRCDIEEDDRQICDDNLDENDPASGCDGMGLCWDDDLQQCYFPIQDCTDKQTDCSEMVDRGDCERNSAYMYLNCALSCEFCAVINQVDLDTLSDTCMDHDSNCPHRGELGKCSTERYSMNRDCPLTCSQCTPIDPLTLGK